MQGIRDLRLASDWNEDAEDDRDLLKAGRAGDPAALERLLTRHERALYRLCRGMLGHSNDAEDAVQETFLRALRALSGFQSSANFRTWLFRIAINLCTDWKRANRLTAPWSAFCSNIAASDASPEVTVLRHQRILDALSGLLPRHRAILLLKEVEGWSIAEIALAMRWNEKRVRNELYKARRALAEWRQREAEEGVEI